MTALVIAIVGAPRTGKTALARALAARIAEATGLPCACVEPPDPHDDPAPGDAWGGIERAAATHDVVVADGTPLLGAVDRLVVGRDDPALVHTLAAHRRCRLTLLTAFEGTDAVAADHDDRLRRLMSENGLPWSVIGGPLAARLDRALDAVTAVLADRAAPRAGLFTRLQQRQAEDDARAGAWVCARCDDPACEHASWRAAQG